MMDNLQRPRIDPVAFRELEIWATAQILDEIRRGGALGMEASNTISEITKCMPYPEWSLLTVDQRTKMCWRQIRRLESSRTIESFYSNKKGHNRSRVRFREVNVLDRIAEKL